MNDNSDPFEIHKACRGRLVATQFATTLTIAVCLVLTNSGLMVGQDAAKTAVQTDSDLPAVVSKYSKGAIKKWESDIVKLEAKDRSEQHPDDSILFIGSSSIRRWNSIADDVAPYHPINRGYGGARYSDLAHYAKRLIEPHKFQAVVVFVANDVSGDKEKPDTPLDDAELLVRHIIDVASQHAPSAPIFIVEVTPTMSRWKLWNKTRRLNEKLREICLTNAQVYFVETAENYLGQDNRPIERFFVEDRLHLNEDGYDVWGTLIRAELDTHLKTQTQQ